MVAVFQAIGFILVGMTLIGLYLFVALLVWVASKSTNTK